MREQKRERERFDRLIVINKTHSYRHTIIKKWKLQANYEASVRAAIMRKWNDYYNYHHYYTGKKHPSREETPIKEEEKSSKNTENTTHTHTVR